MAVRLTGKAKQINDLLFYVMLSVAALLMIFSVALQPDGSLFTGFWAIQMGEAGLITDPICTGGIGAALLNASVLLLSSILLVRFQGMPFTGLTVSCLFMMAGFALLGKNIINSAPILLGGFFYSRYKDEPFTKYTYLTLFGTCLAPMVSYLMLHTREDVRYPAMLACGIIVGFLLPAVSGYTVRIHQGYNLYNVGFSAGFVGLGIASVLKGFGVDFVSEGSWSTAYHWPLLAMALLILLGLFALGVALGCRSWNAYRRILHHSGRAVADFFALDGLPVTFVNMALVGGIGLVYLLALQVPLNGPLVCCIFAMIGFASFGKHPRNVIPVMAGAVLASNLMGDIPLTSPSVLLATLLCSGLAPIAGQFGWGWGITAGFLHMSIVQHTAFLHGGMNLYNNGFAAGLVCVIMIPIIEALKSEPEE